MGPGPSTGCIAILTGYISPSHFDSPSNEATNQEGQNSMNVDQHLKVAKWHIEQARLHSTQDGYSCGCPLNDHDKKAIEAVESDNVHEEKDDH